MKKLLTTALFSVTLLTGCSSTSNQTTMNDIQILPISHATAVIKWDNQVIYTDPVGGKEAFKNQDPANLVLLSDIHGDHLDPETIRAVLGQAKLIAPQSVKDILPEDLAKQVEVMHNGETVTENAFEITAMPMYNLPESPTAAHVKGRGNGYLIKHQNKTLYLAGDTADIPEMRALKNVDVALVPMNLPYTMTVEQAASAVLEFQPKKVYPYHYRGKEGFSDVQRFKQLVNQGNTKIEVVLANWYPKNK